jgi:hypothetical protein
MYGAHWALQGRKYLLNTFIYLYDFRSGVAAPHLWLARVPSHVSQAVGVHTHLSALWTASGEDITESSTEMSVPQMMDRERSRTPFIAIPAPTAASRSAPVIQGAVLLLIFWKLRSLAQWSVPGLIFFYFQNNKCIYKNGLGNAHPALCSTVL